jgi:hypothetical protein
VETGVTLPVGFAHKQGETVRRFGIVLALGALAAVLYIPAATATTGPQQLDCTNYSPCVPIAEDVDCVGGGGNGPVFIDYRVNVIGADPYQLDNGGEPGVGCEDQTGTGPTGPTVTTQPTRTQPPVQSAPPAGQTSATPRFTG